jgi:hypothetical protein
MFAWVGLSLPVHDRKFQHYLMKKLFGMVKEEEKSRKQRRGVCCVAVVRKKKKKNFFSM